ncbi:MAG: twin transmembrane helix small protein [Nevskia sp.]|nr:twin transmembrane helix small protein [Nevskia sp.]
MLVKIIIVAFLVAILASLFSGLYFLLKDPSTSNSRRTVRALTVRVALSITFALFLALAYFMGWIHPHGVGQ